MWLDLTFVAVLSVNLKFILYLGYKLNVHFRLLTVTNTILLNVCKNTAPYPKIFFRSIIDY